MNCIFLVGNLTGDIYYDRLRIKQVERPFLRLILMSSRPRFVGGMRVVLWDEKAELFFPYLQRGSEIAAVGHLQTREWRLQSPAGSRGHGYLEMGGRAYRRSLPGHRLLRSSGPTPGNLFLRGWRGLD